MQAPIIKTNRGRHRVLPNIQCSVCLEKDAIAVYGKTNGKIYLNYIHRDKIVDIKYYKNRKTGKKDRALVYKTCHAGVVSAGLPIANENKPIPVISNVTNGKINAKLKHKDKQSQTPQRRTESYRIRKSLEDILLRLKNAEETDGKPFVRVAYTRTFK